MNFKKQYRLMTILAFYIFAAIGCSNMDNSNIQSTTPANKSGGPCIDQPLHDASLMSSTANSVSHYAGKDCMACHSIGGMAQSRWIVAGTMVTAQNSTTPATGSTVKVFLNGAGTATPLKVDICGNFYEMMGTFNNAQQPCTGACTGALTNTMQSLTGNGSCNTSTCHDNNTLPLLNHSFVY